MAAIANIERLLGGVPFPLFDETKPGPNGASPVLGLGAFGSFGALAQGSLEAPPWWSRSRDRYLRDFWKTDDHLSGAIYAMQAKMTAIPFRVFPINTHIKQHAVYAEDYERNLRENSEIFQGWNEAYGKFIIDLHSQDNGAFFLIMGGGPSDGPIEGPAIGVKHLESYRCTRTGNMEYPVIYQNTDNKYYKLHHARVIFFSQMPSPQADMFGVGICAVSRALQSVRRLIDISDFSRSKMGSKPLRAFLAVNGITDENLAKTIRAAELEMANNFDGVFARIVALASLEHKLDIDLVDLASLPDGFDEDTTTRLAMYTIALAFGVDARELFPSSESGATKASAEMENQKARGKAPGHIMRLVEHQINLKFLPHFLRFEFDFQDDEQDKYRAEIGQKRANARQANILAGTFDIRASREDALAAGDLTQPQFDRMELSDGRLPDGTSVLALFFSNDPEMSKYLNLEVDNPFSEDIAGNDALSKKIEDKEKEINTILVNTSNPAVKQKAQQALAALDALKKQGEEPEDELEEEPEDMQTTGGEIGQDASQDTNETKPGNDETGKPEKDKPDQEENK